MLVRAWRWLDDLVADTRWLIGRLRAMHRDDRMAAAERQSFVEDRCRRIEAIPAERRCWGDYDA